MKLDIESTADIKLLVDTFYDKVKDDHQIGHFFTEDMNVDWDIHLPKMYKFWENIVFHTGVYSGNPMQIHMGIHAKFAMTGDDFKQWLILFSKTIDELFEGLNATLIKQRALSIATTMKLKVVDRSQMFS